MKVSLGEKDTPKYGEARVELVDSLEMIVKPETQRALDAPSKMMSPAECGESFGQLRQDSHRERHRK